MPRPSRARVVEAEAVAVEAPAPPVEAPAVEALPVEPEELEAPPPAVAPDVLRRRRVALAIAGALTDEELTRAERWAARRAAGTPAPAAPPRAGTVSGPVILAGIIGAAALMSRRGRRR